MDANEPLEKGAPRAPAVLDAITSLDELGHVLRGYLAGIAPGAHDVAAVQSVLHRYQGDDWKKHEIQEPGRYTRVLVFDGDGSMNGLVLTWPPNKKKLSVRMAR